MGGNKNIIVRLSQILQRSVFLYERVRGKEIMKEPKLYIPPIYIMGQRAFIQPWKESRILQPLLQVIKFAILKQVIC